MLDRAPTQVNTAYKSRSGRARHRLGGRRSTALACRKPGSLKMLLTWTRSQHPDNDGRLPCTERPQGRNEVVQLLVDRVRSSTCTITAARHVNGDMKGMTWLPLNYAQGLCVSECSRPKTSRDRTFMRPDARRLEIRRYHVLDLPHQGLKGCSKRLRFLHHSGGADRASSSPTNNM